MRTAFAPLPLRWLVVPAALAIAVLFLDRASDLDRTITRLAYDAHTAGFPLRTNFWLDVVMHHWTKYVVVSLGCLATGGLLLSFVLRDLRNSRRLLLFIALALSLAPVSVAAVKAVSDRHCPWDVEEFGGFVPYTRMFEPAAPNIKAGHCFPAGHASTGFALMAFYFAAYSRRMRKAASWALAMGIAAGLTLGSGRVLQGAHFASHVLWSGLLCWTVMLLLYRLCLSDGAALEIPAASSTPAPARP